MKKIIVVVLVSSVFLIMCWGIGTVIHSDKEIQSNDTEESINNENDNTKGELIGNWDLTRIEFENSKKTDDNPWGFTAGLIDVDAEGKCIFLTPNTSVSIYDVSEYSLKNGIIYQFMIHPWVSESSDGAGIDICYLNENDEVLKQDSFIVDNSDLWQEYVIECDNDEVSHIKLLCNNGANDDDNADWVIVKKLDEVLSDFGKDDYVRSVTYFGDEWPINFWNSEFDNIDKDFEQIRNDGFNSIIIVIPWKEFQISTNPIEYSDYAFTKLDFLMEKAAENDLDVYARIGYSWDYYSDTNEYITERYLDILRKKETREAWMDYSRTLYAHLRNYSNFKDGFITWEDFWGCLAICDEPDYEKRLEYSKTIGFQEWLSKEYELDTINENYQKNYSSYYDIPVPDRSSDSMMFLFYEFYDQYLMNLLCETQTVFPNISMEVRLDWDGYIDVNGDRAYYSHTPTYGCFNSNYTATMYGIPMGCKNEGEKISSVEALEHTEYILNGLMDANGGKPVYIEQFLFLDNTPQFSYNAQIKEDEVDDYLENVSKSLLDYSKGYGIWTYRDYYNNMIYNSQFDLRNNGWNIEGEPEFEDCHGSMSCYIEEGDAISQSIPEIRNHFPNETYSILFDIVEMEKGSELSVFLGNQKKVIDINETGSYRIEFEAEGTFDLEIRGIKGKVVIDNIKLYSFIQKGYLYDENNIESDYIESIRILNKQLDLAY